MSHNLVNLIDLGVADYNVAWDLQKSLQRKLIDKTGEQTLIICQHPAVITYGKSSKLENILYDSETLQKKGISIYEIERGGDVTYHAPGQLIGYPILDLHNYKKDVGWYMRSLELVLINATSKIGVKCLQIQGRTGVWTLPSESDNFYPHRKIASIGVRLSRWVSMHGFALNVLDNLLGFSSINPCGFSDVKMTSIESELQSEKSKSNELFSSVKKIVLEEFASLFNCIYQEDSQNGTNQPSGQQ